METGQNLAPSMSSPPIVAMYKKDYQRVYTAMCANTLEHTGICTLDGVEELMADMRFKDENLPWHAVSEQLAKEDFHVASSDKSSRSTTFVPRLNDTFVMCTSQKWPDGKGGTIGRTICIDIDDIYHGWPARLNVEKQRLDLPNGDFISRLDLRILYCYLRGVPRKVIAYRSQLSLKGVEKRLTRLRKGTLATHKCDQCSLHDVLDKHGLVEFLMAQRDWLDIKPSHSMA